MRGGIDRHHEISADKTAHHNQEPRDRGDPSHARTKGFGHPPKVAPADYK